MKTSTKMTSAALAVMTLGSAAFSTGAFADAQQQKNNWRNIGAGAAAVGLLGVKNHDSLITILGAAGAAYSAQQYEKNRKAEDAAARQHQQNYYRRYHRYDSTSPSGGLTTNTYSTNSGSNRYTTGNYVNRNPNTQTFNQQAPGSVTYYPQSRIAVNVDGQPVAFNGARPIQSNNTVLVPLRGVFEAMGATVDFDNATKTIIAEKNNRFVRLPLGSSMANVNGQAENLSMPAKVVNGTTLVPLRFVAESLGSTVNWAANTQTVNISTDSNNNTTANNTSRMNNP